MCAALSVSNVVNIFQNHLSCKAALEGWGLIVPEEMHCWHSQLMALWTN